MVSCKRPFVGSVKTSDALKVALATTPASFWSKIPLRVPAVRVNLPAAANLGCPTLAAFRPSSRKAKSPSSAASENAGPTTEASCLLKTPLIAEPAAPVVLVVLMMCPSDATPDEIPPKAKSKVRVPAAVFSVNLPRLSVPTE